MSEKCTNLWLSLDVQKQKVFQLLGAFTPGPLTRSDSCYCSFVAIYDCYAIKLFLLPFWSSVSPVGDGTGAVDNVCMLLSAHLFVIF